MGYARTNVIGSRTSFVIASVLVYTEIYIFRSIHTHAHTVGYARTNVIGSRTSFVTASVRSSIH